MSKIETWSPNQKQEELQQPIDQTALNKFINISKANKLNELEQQLDSAAIAQHQPLMKKHKSTWEDATKPLTTEELVHLVKFFTVAEMQLSGWEAGSKSPVVWICRALKSRNAFPDSELTAWIKKNTDNKFLPYGNILDL